jgi:hypothetical protein
LGASRLVSAIEKVHDVFAGGTPVAATMRDEEDVAFAEKKRGQLRKPAGAALAAVVPEDGGEGAFPFRFIEEAVKNEIAAWEGDFDGICLRTRRSRL